MGTDPSRSRVRGRVERAGVAVAAISAFAATATAAATGYATSGSLKAAQEQVAIAQQGQITDRFGKATEQLGSSALDVRLGAIYSLERLMSDSPADQPTVMEVLSAYIRDHTSQQKSHPAKPATDVQAALTVLGRRDPRHDSTTGGIQRSIDLTGANLTGANLYGAHLNGAHLNGAHLNGAHLNGAHLSGAHLSGAHLSGADLSGADLSGADLSGADSGRADLRGADLSDAHLNGADFGSADLRGAYLIGADLRNAIFGVTYFASAGFNVADLRGAQLNGADLRGADFVVSYWTRAFSGADFSAVHWDVWYGADLSGADLTCVRTDAKTTLPAGTNVPTGTDCR